MGRKRARLGPTNIPNHVQIYETPLLTLLQQQERGDNCFGDCLYPPGDRTANTLCFYPLPLDAPNPAEATLPFTQEQFHVETPNAWLLDTPLPHLATALRVALNPKPTSQVAHAHDRPRTLRSANPDGMHAGGSAEPKAAATSGKEEYRFVERMRSDKKTWEEIAKALPGNRTTVSIRKQYAPRLKAERQNATKHQRDPSRPERVLQGLSGPMLKAATAAGVTFGTGSAPDPSAPLASQRQAPTDPSTSGRSLGGVRQAAVERSRSPPPQEVLIHGIRRSDAVSYELADRGEGEARITLRKPLPGPPPSVTVGQAHNLPSPEGVQFYEEVEVQDPDNPTRSFVFNVNDHEHCACFHIGLKEDGAIVLSWSDLHAIYTLPDGTHWAEHGYFNDAEDLETIGRKAGRDHRHLLPLGEAELLRRRGRYHSRLQNIEEECWIYYARVPPDILPERREHAFYWNYVFDPYTLERKAGPANNIKPSKPTGLLPPASPST